MRGPDHGVLPIVIANENRLNAVPPEDFGVKK